MASRPDGPIRVLLADDHPMFREGLRSVLAAEPEMEVVGEAATGDDVVALAADIQPDVVVMDLQMPGIDGIEATRQIVQTSPHIGVLVLTMFEDQESLFAAMRAGACGYLVKGSKAAGIVRAVQAVADGEAIFGPALAQQVMTYFSSGNSFRSAVQRFPQLTEREREILEMIAQGHNNPTIASRLYVSPKTVRNHISNIFTKPAVADRAEAIVRAREAGYGSAPTRTEHGPGR